MTTSGLPQIRQNYDFLYRVYQLERCVEIRSGVSLCISSAEHLNYLSFQDLNKLLQAKHLELLPQISQIYLLVSRFRNHSPEDLQAIFDATFIDNLRHFLMSFVPVLIRDLEDFIVSAKLSNYLIARNLLVKELNYLESLMLAWAIRIPKRDELSSDTFLSLINYYVALMRTSLGSPLLVELWEQYGLLKRWHLEGEPLEKKHGSQGLKQNISKYKLKDLGTELYEKLQALPEESPVGELLAQTIRDWLKERPVGFNSRYEKRIRELIQAVMQWGVQRYKTVENLTVELIIPIMRYSEADSEEAKAFALYTTIQELMVGTQNLKYRLNECTRGIAIALAHLEAAGEDIQWLMNWALDAILDGIIEVYESFNLADNTLRSFADAYQWGKDELAHQKWKAIQPQVQRLLAGLTNPE